jgi:hypothetical protein
MTGAKATIGGRSVPVEGEPPRGTRLVLVTEDADTMFFGRDDSGRRLTFEWGQPDAHGWYSPTITSHDDDRLSVTPTGAASAREEELRAAIAWEVAEMYRDGTLEPMPITTTREITDRIMRAVLAAEG